MDRGAWQATVHRVTKRQTWMSNYTFTFKEENCCSVTQLYPTLSEPMDCSMPGFLVLLYPQEFAQVHVHWIDDAIQPTHSLHSLLLLLSVFPSIGVFSNESALHIRWPKYWNFSFSISPSNEDSGLISNKYSELIPLGLAGLILHSKGLSRVFSSTTIWKHQFFGVQHFVWFSSHIRRSLMENP